MTPEEIKRNLEHARAAGILPLDPLNTQALLNSSRPKVRLPGDDRELLEFAKEVGDILGAKDLFRRDRLPVVVNLARARLDAMTPQMLRSWGQQHIVFFKDRTVGSGDKSHTIDIVKTMNVDTARGLLESWQFVDKLPEIERVNPSRLPVLRKDNTIDLFPAGYFAEQRVYTLDDGLVYDEAMTLEQAREVLDELLKEFPFRDEGRSKAVAIAAMMTMFGAGLLPKRTLRPAFLYTANIPGAGKTLLAQIAIIPVVGSSAPRACPRKEEMEKVLNILVMDAETYVLFDNIRGMIGGEEIESFITAVEWTGRILGQSSKFRLEKETVVFLTGNESRTTQDMSERSLMVDLFVKEADNRDRKIAKVINPAYLARPDVRSRICSALWTMVKHWDAAGRPPAPSRLQRFEAWSDTIAGIVAHAGYGDACQRAEIASNRGHVQEMRALVVKLSLLKPEDVYEWAFADIMEEVKRYTLFEGLELPAKKGEPAETIFTDDGELTPAARSFFGRFLAKFDGRVFADDEGKAITWVVQGKGNSRKYVVRRETAVG